MVISTNLGYVGSYFLKKKKNTLKLRLFSSIFSLFLIYNLHTTNLQLE